MAAINLSLQVIPQGVGDNVYAVVDKVIAYIASTQLKYVVGPMETTIEGELDQLLEIVKEAHHICIREGASRVLSMIKIDFKPDGVTIDEKIAKYRR